MGQGIQVFGNAGFTLLDTNDTTAKVVGRYTTTGATVYSDLFVTGTPFYIVVPMLLNETASQLNVSFVGNKCTISGTMPSGKYIIVGAY